MGRQSFRAGAVGPSVCRLPVPVLPYPQRAWKRGEYRLQNSCSCPGGARGRTPPLPGACSYSITARGRLFCRMKGFPRCSVCFLFLWPWSRQPSHQSRVSLGNTKPLQVCSQELPHTPESAGGKGHSPPTPGLWHIRTVAYPASLPARRPCRGLSSGGIAESPLPAVGRCGSHTLHF